MSIVLTPDRCALLVIDMSNDFVAEGAPFEAEGATEIVPRLKSLIERCRALSLPVIYFTEAFRANLLDAGLLAERFPPIGRGIALQEGTPGVEIYPDIAPQPDDILVVKRRFSGFFNTELDSILRHLSVDTVIIAGVTTSVCCDSTARDAAFRDYRVVFLSDGTATSGLPDLGYGSVSAAELHRVTLANIAFFFGSVCSVADVLAVFDHSNKTTPRRRSSASAAP